MKKDDSLLFVAKVVGVMPLTWLFIVSASEQYGGKERLAGGVKT